MLLRRAAAVAGRPLFLRSFSQSAAAVVPLEEETAELPTIAYLDGFPRPDPKHDETILAIPRSDSGTSVSVKERKAGRVPAIVFEQEDGQHGGNKRLISVRTNQIRKLVNHLGRSFFLSRLFELEVRVGGFDDDGEECYRVVVERVRVLPRKCRAAYLLDVELARTIDKNALPVYSLLILDRFIGSDDNECYKLHLH